MSVRRFLLSVTVLTLVSVGYTASGGPAKDGQCVQIYYDQGPPARAYQFGRVYATYLRNLLGHFPEFKQIIAPIESYQKGQIERCQATLYLASYFENSIPSEFLKDFATTKKQVAWVGYSIWLYPEEQLQDLFGVSYSHLTTLNKEQLNLNGDPSFFQDISYKGETFSKFGKWVENEDGPKSFVGPFEMVALNPSDRANVLAWAEQTVTGEKYPYALRKDNRFYVADVPFSYVHESDRYLVFSDLLFDILEASPRHEKKPALLRIEDVHPLTSVRELNIIKKVFEEEEVPLNISLIPLFYDPLFRFDRSPEREFVPLTAMDSFSSWLKQAKEDDAFFIWHGVTHQYGRIANPHTGYSSDDFEFWDANNNRPLVEDSVQYVLNRLHLGFEYLQKVGITPQVWLTPHYQASALNYRIFGKVFDWNIGRMIYFLDSPKGLPSWSQKQVDDLRFSSASQGLMERQKEYFQRLETQTVGEWFGQLYPYEIYGDVYGQRVLPEILGNPQPFKSNHVVWPRSVDEILSDAKRNLVIRDSWASMFFHPYLLNGYKKDGIGDFSGDSHELKRLIRGLKELGYEFIHLDQFINKTSSVNQVQFQEVQWPSTK